MPPGRRRHADRGNRYERSRAPKPLFALLVMAVAAASACSSSDPGGSVEFVQPRDGDVVTSPVTVEMAAEGFVVEPAANGVRQGHGHLHIMIDTLCVEPRLTVPPDAQHLHFGLGQTTASLDLAPGEHFLCLQAADANHTALPLTDEITITVSDG